MGQSPLFFSTVPLPRMGNKKDHLAVILSFRFQLQILLGFYRVSTIYIYRERSRRSVGAERVEHSALGRHSLPSRFFSFSLVARFTPFVREGIHPLCAGCAVILCGVCLMLLSCAPVVVVACWLALSCCGLVSLCYSNVLSYI